jgi:hypothetical protein
VAQTVVAGTRTTRGSCRTINPDISTLGERGHF